MEGVALNMRAPYFSPSSTKLLVCLLHVFPLKMCLAVADEIALEHDQFRVLIEGLPTGNSYADYCNTLFPGIFSESVSLGCILAML